MKTPKLAITSQHNNRVDPAILTSSTRLFSDPCRFYPCANVFGITAATTSPFAQHTSSAKTFVCIFHFLDRKSTRLNSSHVAISYAVFCLKKKNKFDTTYVEIL